jgi:hypothetical protein
MSFFRGVFKKEEKRKLIEVRTKWGITYSSEPFLLEEKPNFSEIFSKDSPDFPANFTKDNREYYERQKPNVIRGLLAVGYLDHPNAIVRLEAIEFAKKFYSLSAQQRFVDMLVDSDEQVRRQAAKALWDVNQVPFAIRALGDEYDNPSAMGHSRATSALEILKEMHPERSNEFENGTTRIGSTDFQSGLRVNGRKQY